MTTIKNISMLGLLAITIGFGMSACVAQSDTADEQGDTVERLGEDESALVTCTTDCSATGGASITKTCTTCSATSSSITCNGVTTYCQPPPSLPSCASKCTYGVCSSCDDYGFATNCRIYNGCGHKYPIP